MASWLRTLWPFGDDNEKKPDLKGLVLKYHQWEPMLPPDLWTWGGITSVQITHEAGLFQQSARLSDSLFRDDKVAGLLQNRLLELRGLPFGFVNQDGSVCDDPQLYQDWPKIFPKQAQMEVSFWTLLMGFCIAQLRWDMGSMVPTVQVWHPGNCYWDKTWLQWMVYTREGGPVRLIGENAPGNGKWVLFKTWIDERPWMAGIIRAIGLLLLIRSTILPDFLRYARKFGAPSTWLKTAAMAGEVDDVQKTIDALAQLNNGSIIHLFNDMEIGLIEPNGKGWETFIKFLEYVDRALELLITGASDIASGGTKGTMASAVVKDRPRQGRLENDVDILSSTSHAQILPAYYNWNRGIEDADQIPIPLWDPTPPEDALREAEALEKRAIGAKNAAEALEKLVELVPNLDVEEFALSYKIPLKDRGHAAATLLGRHERLLSATKGVRAVPGLASILNAVKGAKDSGDLAKRVISAYQKMDPDRLARELAVAKARAAREGYEAVEDKLRGG